MIPTFTPTCEAIAESGFYCGGRLPCDYHPVAAAPVDAIRMREAPDASLARRAR